MSEANSETAVHVAAATADPATAGGTTPDETGEVPTPTTGSTNDTRDDDNVKEDFDFVDPDDIGEDDTTVSASGTGTEEDEDSDVGTSPTEDPVQVLIKATNYKEQGNDFFKANDLPKAVRAYRKGTNLLKPFNKGNTGDDQVRGLLVTLQNNLSMVFFKQNKFRVSRDVATKSLAMDPINVKALYRRACAHKQLGDLECARNDLKAALLLEPNNTAVKKELQMVKKSLVDYKTQQKKALAAAFSSNNTNNSLYQDKEQEKQLKLLELQKKRELEKLEKQQRKQAWEDECVQRMAKGEAAITFEEWDKERIAQETKRKKELEQQQKEERRQRQAAKKAALAAAKQDESSDDEELTPAELASLRGYKKTADGRVTSYFTREPSQHEKEILSNMAPQRLESTSTPTLLSTGSGSTNGDADENVDTSGLKKKQRPSAWNQAGTWEEKDTTQWCSDQLTLRLLQATSATTGSSLPNDKELVATITKVESLTGHASVAITNGKKRYIFDYHAQLKFQIRQGPAIATKRGEGKDGEKDDDDNKAVIAKGSLHLPDICSTSHDELEVQFLAWKKAPSSAHRPAAEQCQQALANHVRVCVQEWVQDFNHHY